MRLQLVKILRATLLPDQNRDADEQLAKFLRTVKFAPLFLNVICNKTIELSVRQQAAICLKILCIESWKEQKCTNRPRRNLFAITYLDEFEVQEYIVEALIQAPESVRVQLAECVRWLVKFNYAQLWPVLAKKAEFYLMADHKTHWIGALICIYQLVKDFRFETSAEMNKLLPLCYERMTLLLPDCSDPSLLLQKQILKIFRALIQDDLPQDLITEEMFRDWIDVFVQIISRPESPETHRVDDHEKAESAWWKTKKWASRIILTLVQNYCYPPKRGSKYNKYEEFTQFYITTFSESIVKVQLEVLNEYRQQRYVSSQVLRHAIRYLHISAERRILWSVIKQEMQAIIKQVIFPLMCPNKDDEDLWKSDPIEYTRARFERCGSNSPAIAAAQLLHVTVLQSKTLFDDSVQFIQQELANGSPQQTTGALHMLGDIIDLMCKKRSTEAENLMAEHIFQAFRSKCGYLRATACWSLCAFQVLLYKHTTHLAQAVTLLTKVLCRDSDHVVKVLAVYAISGILRHQGKTRNILRYYLPAIMKTFCTMHDVEDIDLTRIMHEILSKFSADIVPIVRDVFTQLAKSYGKLLESNMTNASKVKGTRPIVAALARMIHVVRVEDEALLQTEGLVLSITRFLIESNGKELYTEIFSLLRTLTSARISSKIWQNFHLFHKFAKDERNVDHLQHVIPVLYNVVHKQGLMFISDPLHLAMFYDTCFLVLEAGACEEARCGAATLMQIVLLHYKDRFDIAPPNLYRLIKKVLMSDIESPSLRTSCLLVVIAAFCHKPALVLKILNISPARDSSQTFMDIFLDQWFKDMTLFTGIRGRKLCVLGLCCLLEAPPELQPPCLQKHAAKVIPSIIRLLKDLQKMYIWTEFCHQDSPGPDEPDSPENPVIDDLDAQCICSFFAENGDTEDVLACSELLITSSDVIDSSVDEFKVFKEVVQSLRQRDPPRFAHFTSTLTVLEQREVDVICKLSETSRAVRAEMVSAAFQRVNTR